MILTIGMIVKNEEKYLERCLTAIKPILENVDSELIIADTGSTDNTVEIAKKFTDNVFHFEWINDFAAARNSTLERAKGEWYMFIDADEIFQNCDDIIHFFNSGEYKSYKDASYTIRSYTSEDNLNSYTDSNSVRLAQLDEDVRFVNAIHEGLSPVKSPVKFLNVIADHYGYFFRKDGEITENAKKKSSRNLELLLKSLDNVNLDFSVYKEIADCYQLVGDMENALKYLNIGLEKNDHHYIPITSYYASKGAVLLSLKRYDEVINICDKYFSKDNPSHKKTLASDMDIYAMRGEAKFRLGKNSEAVEDYCQFFNVYKKYESGRLNTDDLLYNVLKSRSKRSLKAIYGLFMYACISSGRFNTAEEYLKGCPVEYFQDDRKYMLRFSHLRIHVMEKTSYKSAKSYASRLDDYNGGAFIRLLRWKVFFTDKTEELLAALCDLSEYEPLLPDAVNIYRSYFIDDDLQYEQITDFIDKYGANYNTDILCMALERNMDISPFITAKDFNANSYIHALYTDYTEYIHFLEDYDINKISRSALNVAVSVYIAAITEAIKSGRNITRFFAKYGETAVRWQNEFPESENIPSDVLIGLIADSISKAHLQKDYKLCISEMRRLIHEYPKLAPVVKEYQKILQSEINPVHDERSQLSEMAAVVKKNIRSMIESGNFYSAFNALNELEKLCPGDPEIDMLREEIGETDGIV